MNSSYMSDFSKVVRSVATQLARLFSNFYDNPRFNFLFNMALMPIILMFVFDIIMTFILSFKIRKLVIFNVLSARSWSFLNANHIQNRLKADNVNLKRVESKHISIRNHHNVADKKLYDGRFRFFGLTRLGMLSLFKLKKRDSKFKGVVFHKKYENWQDNLPKVLSRQNMLLSQILNRLNEQDKNRKKKK